jgi:hypothetical protein
MAMNRSPSKSTLSSRKGTVMTVQFEPPSDKIPTRDAAEAILHLYYRFDGVSTVDVWIDELQGKWPDLAAQLFTAVRDE